MKEKLRISLNKDEKLFDLIFKNKSKLNIKKFTYEVKILKNKYLQMIRNRYMSTLLNFTDEELKNGIIEIKNDYGNLLKFKDRLICFILKK